MIQHITPAASSASEKARELLNRCRTLRIIDRHGDRHKWKFRCEDLIAFAGGWFEAQGLGFRICRSDRECVEIETDASVAEILMRVRSSAISAASASGQRPPRLGSSAP